MTTKNYFLMITVISIAAGALLLAYWAPTQAGGHSLGRSSGGSSMGSSGSGTSTDRQTIPFTRSTESKSSTGGSTSGQSSESSMLQGVESGKGKPGGSSGTQTMPTSNTQCAGNQCTTTENIGGGESRQTTKTKNDDGTTEVGTVVYKGDKVIESTLRAYDAQGNVTNCVGDRC